jgi:hypothetical protein
MIGHRSLYHDGWRAVCPWLGTSFKESGRKFGDVITSDMLTELDAKGWELYHVDEDVAATKNLADKKKARLMAMIGLWHNEGRKYNRPADRQLRHAAHCRRAPALCGQRNLYTLYPGPETFPAASTQRIPSGPHSISAEVESPRQGAEASCSASVVATAASFFRFRAASRAPSTVDLGCTFGCSLLRFASYCHPQTQ